MNNVDLSAEVEYEKQKLYEKREKLKLEGKLNKSKEHSPKHPNKETAAPKISKNKEAGRSPKKMDQDETMTDVKGLSIFLSVIIHDSR